MAGRAPGGGAAAGGRAMEATGKGGGQGAGAGTCTIEGAGEGSVGAVSEAGNGAGGEGEGTDLGEDAGNMAAVDAHASCHGPGSAAMGAPGPRVVRCALGNVGVRGVVDELDVESLRTVVVEEKLDIVGVTEHWRGRAERVRRSLGLRESEEERMEGEALLGCEWQWLERCRLDGGRGGVGLALRRTCGVGTVLEEMSSAGVLWVRVDLAGGGRLFVAVVYLAPKASVFTEEVEKAVSGLARGLHWLRVEEGEKNVMVLGDMNGRIGGLDVELELGEGVVTMTRESDDTKVDDRGTMVMGLLQAYGLMVLNGLDGAESGRATCRGKTVVDWVAVPHDVRYECSPLSVEEGWMSGEGGRRDGDHSWLRFDWSPGPAQTQEPPEARAQTQTQVQTPAPAHTQTQAQARVQRRTTGCNRRRGWLDGWKSLRQACWRVMGEWCRERSGRLDGRESLEEVVASWLEAYEKVVEESIGWSKKRTGGRKTWYDKEVAMWNKKMREQVLTLMRETDEDKRNELTEGRRTIRRERQRAIRKKRSKSMMVKMREIEKTVGPGRGGDLLRMLQEWSGRPKKALGGDRVRMRDSGGKWYEGEELKTKWRRTFEEVGELVERRGGFDEKNKERVEEAVDGWKSDWPVDEEIEMEWDGGKQTTSLDGEVRRWEVARAVKKLKNGKSVGVDGVVAEVLKHGGEWMGESVWWLCWLVFRGEKVPLEWLRAVKVPVKKKGSGEEFEHYRGVTLLSVVGKVFGMVMEARLRVFCESRGILSDAQFGFREGWACRDALFVVTEVVERRAGERVFAGFLDMAKAYPSVWRKGLWFRLWEVGVRGRMWRVLRTLYSRCEVSVRVGGQTGEWYEEFVGVREGCVLSPLLFAIYVNDLPSLLEKEGGGGVRVGDRVVRCLMFADDIVMLASTREGLQRSFDIAGEFSKRWRFKFNFGADKTAVMVFGGRRGGEAWALTGREVPVVEHYRYLGVRLMAGGRGRWMMRRDELLTKARGAFWRAWGLGMSGGWLSAKGARGLWETLVRPVLEYGAEVDSGRWEQAEVLQRLAGRMCLGVGREVPNEVVMGDLGWWTVQARREYLRLVFWGKLVRESKGGVVRQVYDEGRRRMREGSAGKREWCVETKRVLEEVGLGDLWRTQEVGTKEQWKALVRGVVKARQGERWRKGVMTKTTLEAYLRTKTTLTPEWFLGENRTWVRRWVRLRASASCLEVSVGRRRRVFRDVRVCGWCEGGVEDEEHFLDECKGWRKERTAMWEGLRGKDDRLVRQVSGWSRQERVDWLLRGGNNKVRGMVLVAVGVWLAKRGRAGSGKAGSERWGERFSAKFQSRIDAQTVRSGVTKAGTQERPKKRRLKNVAPAAEEAGGKGEVVVGYDHGMRVGDMMYTRWGEAVVRKVHEDGDVECEWKGYDGVFTLTVPEVTVGDKVRTKWGDAKVSVVYEDGDVGCVWKGWEDVYTVGRNDVWVVEE